MRPAGFSRMLTDGRTYGRTVRPFYRDTRTHLKSISFLQIIRAEDLGKSTKSCTIRLRQLLSVMQHVDNQRRSTAMQRMDSVGSVKHGATAVINATESKFDAARNKFISGGRMNSINNTAKEDNGKLPLATKNNGKSGAAACR